MTENRPLVLVSNRGPVTYQDDGSVKRGTGGLVTALTRKIGACGYPLPSDACPP